MGLPINVFLVGTCWQKAKAQDSPQANSLSKMLKLCEMKLSSFFYQQQKKTIKKGVKQSQTKNTSDPN